MMNRDALRYDALKLAVKAGHTNADDAERYANEVLDLLLNVKIISYGGAAGGGKTAKQEQIKALREQLATNERTGNEPLTAFATLALRSESWGIYQGSVVLKSDMYPQTAIAGDVVEVGYGFKIRKRDDGKWEQVPKANLISDAELAQRLKVDITGKYAATGSYSDEDLKDIYGRD